MKHPKENAMKFDRGQSESQMLDAVPEAPGFTLSDLIVWGSAVALLVWAGLRLA